MSRVYHHFRSYLANMSQISPNATHYPTYTDLTGIHIRTVYRLTAYYLIACSSDRTKQLLLSLDHSTEPDWQIFLESVAQRLDEYFNPGPGWANKRQPGKAVEVLLMIPKDKLSDKIKDEFYGMMNKRVLFYISKQRLVRHSIPSQVGKLLHLSGAPNRVCLLARMKYI